MAKAMKAAMKRPSAAPPAHKMKITKRDPADAICAKGKKPDAGRDAWFGSLRYSHVLGISSSESQ
eukprot:5583773-Pyramimonas_sp.AAC.1